MAQRQQSEKPKSKTLLERLRQRGLQLTAQRRVVAEVLEGVHVHLTAEQIFDRAAARLPEISRATVYNTLNQFRELGEVREIMLDARSKRYDPNSMQCHQHLVCERCGTVRDVVPHGDLSLPHDQRYGFAVSAIEVTFRGLCPECAQQ
ncbi:MAG TPA: Fur family transcriptional regulator [Candidatus Binataceae bacterium]|nr:Fur family transcriptional regulator [Candidatus Binataceae bacterium]